jgi:hypothetical protein
MRREKPVDCAERFRRWQDAGWSLIVPSARSYRCCLTLIGIPAQQQLQIRGALESVLAKREEFTVRSANRIAELRYPAGSFHAVVIAVGSARSATVDDVDAVRQVARLGGRVLLLDPEESAPLGSLSLDDLIQRISPGDVFNVGRFVGSYFSEARALRDIETARARRDRICIKIDKKSGILWSLSYIAAGFHALHGFGVALNIEFFHIIMMNPYLAGFATLFGFFFVAHSIGIMLRHTSVRRIFGQKLRGDFYAPVGFFTLVSGLTIYSISRLDVALLEVLICSALAVAAYAFCNYAYRIHLECTSLSDLQTKIGDPEQRRELFTHTGRLKFHPSSLPFFSCKSRSCFISYARDSVWSARISRKIEELLSGRGLTVFVDHTSMEGGASWRMSLMRGISECGWFLAIIDESKPHTDWVLAESAVAAVLRKYLWKPNIILVLEDVTLFDRLKSSPFAALYSDVFAGAGLGVAVLGIGNGEHTELIPKIMSDKPRLSVF